VLIVLKLYLILRTNLIYFHSKFYVIPGIESIDYTLINNILL